MKINYPRKTIKKVISRILNKKSSRHKASITEDDLDHIGTELYDELGPIATEEEDAKYGLKGKGWNKPEPEDGM